MSSFIWRELYIISDDTQTNNVSVSARISSCLFVTLSSSLIIGNDEQEKYSVYIERWVSYWRPTTARPDSWCECFHASQTTASSAVPAGGPLSDERRRFSPCHFVKVLIACNCFSEASRIDVRTMSRFDRDLPAISVCRAETDAIRCHYLNNEVCHRLSLCGRSLWSLCHQLSECMALRTTRRIIEIISETREFDSATLSSCCIVLLDIWRLHWRHRPIWRHSHPPHSANKFDPIYLC